MAVTIDVDALRRELRVGDTLDETALLTARLAYATEAVTHRAPSAPDTVHNEACIVLSARLYDKPTSGIGARYAYAGRDSGAWAMLAPYRIHRAGLVGGAAVDAANADGMGTPGNPVTGVDYTGDVLTVTYADGTIVEFIIVAGGGDTTIVNAPNARLPFTPVEMRIGWLQTPDTVVTAATFAPPATVGTTAQTLVPDFPQAFLDLGLRRANLAIWAATDLDLVAVTGDYINDAAGTALEVDGVEGSYWVTDALIGLYDGGNPVTLIFSGDLIATQKWVIQRIADIMLSGGGITAAQAQALIDAAIGDFQTATEIQAIVTAAIAGLPNYQTLAEVNALITTAIAALSLGQSAVQVQALIDLHAAMPEIHHAPPTGADRLPSDDTAMRLGWELNQVISITPFTRVAGKAIGTVAGLDAPSFPPAFSSEPRLYFAVWIAATPAEVTDILKDGLPFSTSLSAGTALTVAGVDGTAYITGNPIDDDDAVFTISAVVTGDLIASQPWVLDQIPEITPGGGLAPVLIGSATVVGTPISVELTLADSATFFDAFNAGTYPGGYRFTVHWDSSATVHNVISQDIPADLYPSLELHNGYYVHASSYTSLVTTGLARYFALNRISDKVIFISLPGSDDLVEGTVFRVYGLP